MFPVSEAQNMRAVEKKKAAKIAADKRKAAKRKVVEIAVEERKTAKRQELSIVVKNENVPPPLLNVPTYQHGM
jgi:hypothetical protein